MTRKTRKSDELSIFFILDGSGSMAGVQEDVIGGVNGFVADQQANNGDSLFSLTVFDTKISKPYEGVAVKDVKPVTAAQTFKGGMTALLDAVGMTVSDVEATPLKGKKLVVIYTDGLENSSREWTNDKIKALIERLEAEGDWTFTFLSADVDNFSQASAMGIAAGNYATTDSASTGPTLQAVSRSSVAFAQSPVAQTASFVADYGLDKALKKTKRDSEEQKS